MLTLCEILALSKALSGQAKWKDAVETGAYLWAMENRGSHTGLNGKLKAFERLSIASDSFAPCCTDERGGHMPWICHFSRCRQWFLDILSTIQAVQAVQAAHGSQSTHQPAQQLASFCLLFMLLVYLEAWFLDIFGTLAINVFLGSLVTLTLNMDVMLATVTFEWLASKETWPYSCNLSSITPIPFSSLAHHSFPQDCEAIYQSHQIILQPLELTSKPMGKMLSCKAQCNSPGPSSLRHWEGFDCQTPYHCVSITLSICMTSKYCCDSIGSGNLK